MSSSGDAEGKDAGDEDVISAVEQVLFKAPEMYVYKVSWYPSFLHWVRTF
jgi:hypothetical protein